MQAQQRTEHLHNGLWQTVSMFKSKNRNIFQLKSFQIIEQLEKLKLNKQPNGGSLFDFNVYELANLVIAQLRNLLREGFNFKQKDNSLAYAIIHMMQINILWHCFESKEVQQAGGPLTAGLVSLVEQMRKNINYCLNNCEAAIQKFDLADPSFRDLLIQVLKDKQKYLKTAKYQDQTQNNSFKALHQVYLHILGNLRQKIKRYLILPDKQTKASLIFYCDRIYLKICYLQVATNTPLNKKIIQELANTQDQRSSTFIYLLDSPLGMVKLLNYFQQAPTSALVKDKRQLKIRFQKLAQKKA